MQRSSADRYAEWLATPPPEGVLVETVEFVGEAMVGSLRVCNRRTDPLVATDENGITKTYIPVAFEMGKPAMRASTEFSTTLKIDGVDGVMLQNLAKISPDDLRKPLLVVVRWYLDPQMLDRPVWPNGLVMRVENIKASIPVIELSLVGGRLPTKRAGTFYGLDRFVGLRPF
jgi:hypothetical protein